MNMQGVEDDEALRSQEASQWFLSPLPVSIQKFPLFRSVQPYLSRPRWCMGYGGIKTSR